ncbi:MAG: prepilin-type N-terminal cleavage/methylation domain-containing protein [Candidatus Liptonbacteria bacterium]|nr:prepilin-type N-terminal cleavage/methylation domain-containing protein [Candidatus Liptonbacteria bacterium]
MKHFQFLRQRRIRLGRTISNFRPDRGGFTLIELLISLGLFSIIVSIAVGGFVRALRTQRQTQALLAANSNASAALEIMAREIRTGSLFNMGSSRLEFRNARGKVVAYQLEGGAIQKSEKNPDDTGRTGFQSITGKNVTISDLSFMLQGVSASDGYPPRVAISFAASPNTTDPAVAGTKVRLATTVSARLADDQPATLVLQKRVNNSASAGTAHADEFELVVRGTNVRPCKAVTLEDDPSGRFANDPNGTWCKFGGADPHGAYDGHDPEHPMNTTATYYVYMAEGEYEADELPWSGYTKTIFELDFRGGGSSLGCGGGGKTIEVNKVKNCYIKNDPVAPN